MEDLTIKMRLDRSQPKAEADGWIDDAKRMEDATAKATAAIKQSHADAAKGVINMQEAVASGAVASDRKRDASGRFVANSQRQQAQAIADAWKASGDATAKSFGAVLTKIDITKLGLSAIKQLAGDFGSAIEAAAQKSKKLADAFSTERDKLRELATVMGEPAGDAFTFKQAQFNQAAGFKPDEGLAFRSQFQNSGAQFKGKTLTDEEFNQYESQAASLIAAKGFDPSESGDLAGTLTGFRDRRGMGAAGSEDALGKLGSGLAILGRGKGRNSVLINQFSMLASASLNEDELKGTFQDSDEVATAISLMSEKHDASAAEMVRAANRGFRDFDGKAKDFLSKAGIGARTKFADAVRKITPFVEAEAKASGVKTEDVLKKYFPDQLTTEAIGTAINRGVGGGVLADREAFAKQNQGPKPALDAIQQFQKSTPGLDRKAEADKNVAELGRAAQFSEVDLLRKQAEARMAARNDLDSTWNAIDDTIRYSASFGTVADPRRSRIDLEASKILAERDPALLNGRKGFDIPSSIEGSNEFFARQMNLSKLRRIDPLGRAAQAPPAAAQAAAAQAGNPAGGAAKDPQMDANNSLLKDIRDALAKIANGTAGQPTPTLPPLADPRMPRKLTR